VDADQLLEEARRKTGLSNFGEENFREPLRRLVAAIDVESRLSEMGKTAIPAMLVGHLANRLEIEDWYARHPEIDDEEIRSPVFIVGMARTGSTALGHMLALDSETRSLRRWEAIKPCPPPEAATQRDDPRIEEARIGAERFDDLVPGMRDALPRSPIASDECLALFNLSISSPGTDGFLHVPSYMAWLHNDFDMAPAYRYNRRILKLLQWRCPPRRWVLRSPTNMYSIEALHRVYPDARFIMTHRDPVKAAPSSASLMHQIRSVFLADPEPEALGREVVEGWRVALQRTLEFRDRIGEEKFFDVSHRDQTRDPLPQIRAIYDWLGWRFDEGMLTRLSHWRDDNPKGAHRPDPAAFGMDLDRIRANFSFYSERFNALF
jgi:hypothetical protein